MGNSGYNHSTFWHRGMMEQTPAPNMETTPTEIRSDTDESTISDQREFGLDEETW